MAVMVFGLVLVAVTGDRVIVTAVVLKAFVVVMVEWAVVALAAFWPS